MNLSKRSFLKTLVVLVLSATAAGALAFGGPSLTKEQKAQIKDVKALHGADSDWMKYYNKGKADKVTALYADDATLMPPGSPPVKGKAAIRAYFDGDIASSQKAHYKFNITGTPDAGVNGDWGWASGSYTVTDKGGHIIDAGKYLSVSHKVKGKWYYVRDTWNSDGDIPQIPGTTK